MIAEFKKTIGDKFRQTPLEKYKAAKAKKKQQLYHRRLLDCYADFRFLDLTSGVMENAQVIFSILIQKGVNKEERRLSYLVALAGAMAELRAEGPSVIHKEIVLAHSVAWIFARLELASKISKTSVEAEAGHLTDLFEKYYSTVEFHLAEIETLPQKKN